MSLTNYTELQASIAAWLVRTDLTAVIPDFITIAESRINAQLRLREMQTTSTLTTVANTQTVALPADWLEFKALSIEGEPFEFMPTDRLRDRASEGKNKPTSYSIEGSNLLVSPTPGSTVYDIDIVYYAKVPSIITNATNWLLTKYPNIYLYGSLVSAWQYLMHNERADYYGNLYTQSIALAKAADVRALSSGSPMMIRTRR